MGRESDGSFQMTIATPPRLDAGSRTATTTSSTCVATANAPGKDIAKKVDQAAKPAKDRDKDNASKGKSAKASDKAAA